MRMAAGLVPLLTLPSPILPYPGASVVPTLLSMEVLLPTPEYEVEFHERQMGLRVDLRTNVMKVIELTPPDENGISEGECRQNGG